MSTTLYPHRSAARPSLNLSRSRIPVRDAVSHCVVHQVQNKRDHMEDTYTVARYHAMTLYGVFDGHSGDDVAKLIVTMLPLYVFAVFTKHAPRAVTSSQGMHRVPTVTLHSWIREAFAMLDKDMFDGHLTYQNRVVKAGSTVVLCLVLGQRVVIANLGDSRCVIVNNHHQVVMATQDHKPHVITESQRIQAANGTVTRHANDVTRVDGSLAVSRTLGDFEMKVNARGHYVGGNKSKVGAQPTMSTLKRPMQQTWYAVLATDGIWDVLTNQQMARSIAPFLNHAPSLARVPTHLTRQAIQRGSGDNITVMLVHLAKNEAPIAKSHQCKVRVFTTAMIMQFWQQRQRKKPGQPSRGYPQRQHKSHPLQRAPSGTTTTMACSNRSIGQRKTSATLMQCRLQDLHRYVRDKGWRSRLSRPTKPQLINLIMRQRRLQQH